MDFDYISIDSVISDWLDQTGHEGHFDEDIISKYAQDEVERLSRGEGSKEFVSMLFVDDYRATLPVNYQKTIQAAYNVFPEQCPPRTEIVEFTQDLFDGTGCKLKMNLDCPKCHKPDCRCNGPIVEINADYLYNISHPEHETKYWNHFHSYTNLTDYPGDMRSNYHPQFRLMFPKMGDFWNIQYNVSECSHLSIDKEISYLIDRPNIIVNFQKGQILLNYLGLRMDDSGRVLVQNDPDVIDAIVLYIEKMLSRATWRKTARNEDFRYYQVTAQEYEIAHKKASIKVKFPGATKLAQYWRNIMMKQDFINPRANLNRRLSEQYRLPGQTGGKFR